MGENASDNGTGTHREHLGGMNRREFVRCGVAAGLAVSAGSYVWSAQESTGAVPTRVLGKTGERVSAIGLGGYHIGNPKEERESIRLMRAAIDQGITFMDNCWDYHDGKSEIWMGKALRDGYRDKVFLMSKIDGRTREAAARQIDESLQRLQTDRIDLMQIHEVIRMEDPERLYAKNGGMEALLKAQKDGKVRFIGFTGHKDPAMHLKMLDFSERNGVRIDAVQMPLNVLDAHYKSFEKEVLPRLVKQQIGVLGMKPVASGHALKTKAVTATECLHYALSLPTSVVITGIDRMEILEQAVSAARTFKPLSKQEVASILSRTAVLAQEGKFEPFKTTTDYDGTVQNPHWMG